MESRTLKTYPILGKSHNPGHPKQSGLQNISNISQKLKKKIVTHKFVDLHLFLPNHDVDNTESYTMSMPRGKKPSLKPQLKPITNYYQWSEAWET